MLVLCLHGAKHLWMRLIWVADIAGSLRVPGIDFAAVVERARTLGIARIVGVSLWLSERLLGAGFATRLARAAAYDFESVEYFRQILKLRERPGDRWRYLWRLTWTPGRGEVAAVELPERLFPLYCVVRIGRLLRKLA